jgi:hypothetical protein
MTKTSIKIKKFWYADIAANGGAGTNWKEIQIGQREATVQFNGSDADVSNYKNVLGNTLESAKTIGDKTLNFQFADLTPSEIAPFVGGTVTTDASGETYAAPENENQVIEKSLKFLTDKNLEFIIPRASIDAFPMVNDDDLHYFMFNSVVLQPTLAGLGSYQYTVLAVPAANDILTFVLAAETGSATIDDTAHTVAIEVANGTVVTALEPVITVSKGASITPNSGAATDFTSPVEYTVEAADGTTQVWTVTVTVAAP